MDKKENIYFLLFTTGGVSIITGTTGVLMNSMRPIVDSSLFRYVQNLSNGGREPLVLLVGWIACFVLIWLSILIYKAATKAGTAIKRGCIAYRQPQKNTKSARRRTSGREFLMLLDKDVRRQCLKGLGLWTKIGLCTLCLIPIMAAVQLVQGNWLGILSLIASAIPLFLLAKSTLRKVRQDILLPAYRKRALENARARFNLATREFNSVLPPKGYRVDVPEASPDSLPRLRVLADEKRLPIELTQGVALLAEAQAELEAAELAEAQAENESSHENHSRPT